MPVIDAGRIMSNSVVRVTAFSNEQIDAAAAAAAVAAAAAAARPRHRSGYVVLVCVCVWERVWEEVDSEEALVVDQALEEKEVPHPPNRLLLRKRVSLVK